MQAEVRGAFEAQGDPEVECEACSAVREVVRLSIEVVEHPGEPHPRDVEAVLVRAARGLRIGCTCRDRPFDLRAKCRELGCRPRAASAF
jgi:hypothetical protein